MTTMLSGGSAGSIKQNRAAGILLAVSSLPSRYGIGAFGEAARQWVRFLAGAGQRYWQILPLGPTGWGDSPYQSFSAFALSPYYIDLDLLTSQGLLDRNEAEKFPWGKRADRTGYAALYHHRETVLRRAFERFRKTADPAFRAFYGRHRFWLDDYALFMAIKSRRREHSWMAWEEALRFRDTAALDRCRDELGRDMDYYIFTQFLAYTQWAALKDYANSQGIAIIGD
ncbi:MAG: 4-alpha-glucanotransferase, partial [Treponema sp.]|nr:4-alpha-glucanotransferase [Treponema sp.]